MRRFVPLLFVGGIALLTADACRARQPESPYRPTATVKDIMDSIIDPSADFLWDSVATIVTLAGTEERQPRSDEEWRNVRRRAIQVIEGTNLILMPDRHVARPGERSENPNVELEPEQIETRIKEDRQT